MMLTANEERDTDSQQPRHLSDQSLLEEIYSTGVNLNNQSFSKYNFD